MIGSWTRQTYVTINQTSTIPNQIVSAVKQVCGTANVCLHEPSFSDFENELLQKCINSTYVSSTGQFVDQFEKEIAEYTGARHAVAVVNGTAALHISLLLAGAERNDEVLVPSLTFVATANAVSYCGAVPHFVDCEDRNLGIDPQKLDDYLSDISEVSSDHCINKNTGRKISVVIPVHIFGHPCKIDETIVVAKKYKLKVIEDAAESLGSFYNGKHTGTFGKFGAISFNGNKIITTGGGGAILTNEDDLADQARHITTTAKIPHQWECSHDQVGYNYRMPNLNAALGCAQFKQLPKFLQSKRDLFEKYLNHFSKLEGIKLLKEPSNCSSNYWLQTIILKQPDYKLRNEILTSLNNAGLMSRPTWKGLHKLGHFRHCPRMDMTTSETLEKKIINLPSSSFLCD